MKKSIIGCTLFRNIKYDRFIMSPYPYYWGSYHKYSIKEYAMVDRYAPISEIDSEEPSLIQFKYKQKMKRLKISSRIRCGFTKSKSAHRVPSIKSIIDRYRNEY